MRETGRALLFAGGLVIVLTAWWRWDPVWAVLASVTMVALTCGIALVRFPSLPTLARAMDRAGSTRDRFATALTLTGATPWEQAARAECAAWLAARDFRGLFPWRIPREGRWLPVVAITLALLRWHGALATGAAEAARVAAQEKAAPTAAALQKIARQLPPEMKAVAEEIQRRAEALQREPATPAEAEKAALSELAGLREMVRALQQRPGAAELQALQEELAKQELTRAAAERMKSGDPAAAARELEEAARLAAADPQSAAALQAALERLARQQQLSEAVREASRNGAAAALRKLAALLREGEGSGSSQAAGRPLSAQELQRLLAALEDLQFGEPAKEAGGALSPGDPGPPALQFPADQPGGETAAQGQTPAGGRPGGEHDTGTTDSPLGERQPSAGLGKELALQGVAGAQGDVASQALAAGADRAKAKRQYKELYDALAPAAEDAVLQEEIPLGSRLFIRRYFDAIRPAP